MTPTCPPEILTRLQADAERWAREVEDQGPFGRINQPPRVRIVSVSGDTVRAELEFQLWQYAQSGSSWGDYFLRIVEVAGDETRVLGEIVHHVTESEDEFGNPRAALDRFRARVLGR